MALIFALLAQAALGATGNQVDAPLRAPAGPPTRTEEFEGHRISPARWRFDRSRNPQGWFNHELQYYGPANARVAHGALLITVRRQTPHRPDAGGQAYTSARLVSRAVYGFGFTEVRAKLPCGRGLWPAIWLLPATGRWPDEGEIDLMEMVGWDPTVVHATLHTALFNHVRGTQRGAEIRVPSACTEYHRYQLDWRPHTITIGVDDRADLRVTDDQPGGAGAWPFTQPFHLLLNVAVGGDWGGRQGVDDAALPQAMSIDYVRHWASHGRAPPASSRRRRL